MSAALLLSAMSFTSVASEEGTRSTLSLPTSWRLASEPSGWFVSFEEPQPDVAKTSVTKRGTQHLRTIASTTAPRMPGACITPIISSKRDRTLRDNKVRRRDGDLAVDVHSSVGHDVGQKP